MKKISYSQLSVWQNCKFQWKLSYVDKISSNELNIHNLYGTALHRTVQTILDLFYNHGESKVIQFDYKKHLLDGMVQEMDSYISENKNISNDITKELFTEFYNDGVLAVNFLLKHRGDYFTKRDWELVGCEVELDCEIEPGINFKGFIDVVLKNKKTGVHKLIDLKKSYRGWTDNQKKEKRKQLHLYKYFYSKQFNVPLDKIELEFIIFKQKVFEYQGFTPKLIQRFEPPAGSQLIKKSLAEVNEFIKEVMSETEIGEYKQNLDYKPKATKQICRFCAFKDKKDICKYGKS